MNRPAALPCPAPVAAALLSRLFPQEGGVRPDWQKIAAATALLRRLCIVSGGPGTGKTTTVVKVLALLLTLHSALRVALAAPTGKAAARLQGSLRDQLAGLPVGAEVKARLPAEAYTVHRLLGHRPGRVSFRHDRDHPLPFDLVVVDEASMLDLALATKLVEALPDKGRLILLGDKDQLSAVETGTVFANLSTTRGMSAEMRESVKALTDETLPETGIGVALRCRGVARIGTSLRTGRRDRGPGRGCQGGKCRSVLAFLAGRSMTIHKAQGSEFERAEVLLPVRDSRVLTRELLYTALTRPRASVRLWARAAVLRDTITRRSPKAPLGLCGR